MFTGKLFLHIIFVILLILCSCKKDSPNAPDISPSNTTISYNALPPPGKLPCANHSPSLNQTEYEKLIKDVYVINNFGLFQAGSTKESAYFHDGLDVVLQNDVKIYAIEQGYVKSIINGGEYYQSIIIGDTKGSDPGDAWSYTHVNNFQFKTGDFVPKGSYIANIHFQGLPHVHLGRAYLSSGSWENFSDLYFVQPDSFFVYYDTKPPLIEKPFYFFKNNSDSIFQQGNPTIVSNDVDIVIGMRETGEYANSKDGLGWIVPDFGDRNCVSRIEYEISGEKIQTVHRKSFDFTKLAIKNDYFNKSYEKVLTVYKFYTIIHPEGLTSGNKFFSYYIITNTDGAGTSKEINVSDQNFAWNTAEKNTDGNPKFPNGKYTIRVTAYDFKGNSATENELVEIKN